MRTLCRNAVRRLVQSALPLVMAVGACGEPATEAVVDQLSQPLRERQEHQLGDGAAGVRQTIEPMGNEVLSGIQVRHGIFVDAIKFRYRDTLNNAQRWSSWVGGGGGGPENEFLFNVGEKLFRVDIRGGDNIDQITFTTSTGRTYGPWGGSGGSVESYVTGFGLNGERREINGLSGGSAGTPDICLNWIKLIDYLPCQTCGSTTETESHVGWGGWGGGTFALLPMADEVLAGLQVRSDVHVNAIRLNFFSPSDGLTRWTGWAGGGGGFLRPELHFNPGEFLVKIDGRVGEVIDGLRFTTNQGRVYGYYGGSGGIPFEWGARVHGGLSRRVSGITGRSGAELDRLEVTDQYYGSCGHLACAQGPPLVAACDPCASKICATDPFCCGTSWDGICVGEVASVCGLSCTTP
jgi:hypothetical protein